MTKMKRIDEKEARRILAKYDHALFTGNDYLVGQIENLYEGTDLEPKLRAIREDRAGIQT
ncbi:MAG: hypothetical protein GTN76_12695 [Candidatus Aenigmarchaeota archaeon]|nr:hypothetical protein [Candidatus Aenigmarchaeota archaeon]